MQEKMVRFQLYITEKQREALRKESEVRERSQGDLVREAIDHFLWGEEEKDDSSQRE